LAIGFRDYQVKKLALATVVDQGLVTHAFVWWVWLVCILGMLTLTLSALVNAGFTRWMGGKGTFYFFSDKHDLSVNGFWWIFSSNLESSSRSFWKLLWCLESSSDRFGELTLIILESSSTIVWRFNEDFRECRGGKKKEGG
jgi:hypothetical protein